MANSMIHRYLKMTLYNISSSDECVLVAWRLLCDCLLFFLKNLVLVLVCVSLLSNIPVAPQLTRTL
jgi:hypothetical protein